LHGIHDTKDRSVLIAGVMDGHGGTSASTMVSEQLPNLLSNQLVVNQLSVLDAFKESIYSLDGFGLASPYELKKQRVSGLRLQ
jgi:serine/threonine protein phosphatase PrpC